MLTALFALTFTLAAPAELAEPDRGSKPKPFHAFVVTDIHGDPHDLSAYKGKTVLVVNTASQCGFTPQYAGLERLYRTYKDRGLVVIGFPSNDFGGQEPGGRDEIHGFVQKNFEATFPLMDKVVVKGEGQNPLYNWLTYAGPDATHGPVKWNFTKFLINPDGAIVVRFPSNVDPMDPAVTAAIEAHLPKK